MPAEIERPPTDTVWREKDRKATAPSFFIPSTVSLRRPSKAAAILPPIASEARRSGSASRCAYRCVVDACVCR
jgi:hypothetical protein